MFYDQEKDKDFYNYYMINPKYIRKSIKPTQLNSYILSEFDYKKLIEDSAPKPLEMHLNTDIYLKAGELNSLIDLALELNDKKWFKELTNKLNKNNTIKRH